MILRVLPHHLWRPLLVLVAIWLTPVAASQDPVTVDTTYTLLTAEEVTALVLAQNPSLAIARLEADIAAAEATPGAAGFLPSVSVGAVQRRSPTPAGLERFNNETLDVTASGRVTVFEGMARFARLERLREMARVRELDAEALSLSLVAEAQIAYFDVARLQQSLVVLREAVALSEERFRIARGRFDVGAASELEVTRAEVDLNADRAVLIRQEAALEQTRARLNRLLNRPEATTFRAQDEVVINPSLDLPTLKAAALDASPSLRAEERAQRAAELQTTAIRREIWPRLDLTVGYVFSDLTDPLLPPGQTAGFSYGLTTTFDLFDGFDRRRRLEAAGLRNQQQALALERTRANVLSALESTYALYNRSLQLVELEEANVQAARRNAAVALERFRLGASTSIELREVQRALIDAESRLVGARFEAKAAEVDLRALTGRLPRE